MCARPCSRWTAGQSRHGSALIALFLVLSQIEESQKVRGHVDSRTVQGAGALVAGSYTANPTRTAVTFSAVRGDRWSERRVIRGPLRLVALHLSR